MKTRALPLLLSVTLASLVMAGCSSRMTPPGMAASQAKQGLRARGAVEDAMDFHLSAKKAIDLVSTNPGWKNPRLISVEGHSLDQHGKAVPLLGSYWVFKFWANPVDEEGTVSQEIERADVILHIEGEHEVIAGGESKLNLKALERVLDPQTLASPEKIVPYAIALGLKVNPAGPMFNYYDVTYNSFYLEPSAAKTDVADVTSYYQKNNFDGLHIPARADLIPIVLPGTKPQPAPGVTRMSPQELARESAERAGGVRLVAKRQHI